MPLLGLKHALLADLRAALQPAVAALADAPMPRPAKSARINDLIAAALPGLAGPRQAALAPGAAASAAMVVEYCRTVVALECRHHVWPYNAIDFARRVGERWERFCAAAWAGADAAVITRLDLPAFPDIRADLRRRIAERVPEPEARRAVLVDVDRLLRIGGEPNIRADLSFRLRGRAHVIDFKSGFGSNEHGNKERIVAIGNALQIWDPAIRLLLLVRQERNNHYLRAIAQGGVWEVVCGDAAYDTIAGITGADVAEVRRGAVDFGADLAPTLHRHLRDIGAADCLAW